MRTIEDTDKYFEAGFPLEVPPIVLPWGKPLNEIAQATNARWSGDRYFWAQSSFLFGLEYALMSDVGISQEAPFTQITALIGLDLKSGLWSDQLSVQGFKEVGDHLISLLGEPTGQSSSTNSGNSDGDYLSWETAKTHIYLGVVEIHCLRCTLRVSHLGLRKGTDTSKL